MTTQTAVLAAPTGLTLTAKLFTLAAPDTTAFTADSVTERTNAKAQYVASFDETSAISGDHTLILFSGTRPVAIGYRTFAGTDGETATETPIAVELDSATSQKIDDILTDTGTTLPGLIGDIEGGGGSTTVTVLPATGIVANRSAGVTLLPVVGETISQAITVYQSDGTTAVDLSGKTLKIIFETMSGVDVAVVLDADITISGTDDNVVTFAYPSAVTASERSLRFALRDAAAPLTMYLQGICSVVAAPKVDA
jgi:hypothetical protein